METPACATNTNEREMLEKGIKVCVDGIYLLTERNNQVLFRAKDREYDFSQSGGSIEINAMNLTILPAY